MADFRKTAAEMAADPREKKIIDLRKPEDLQRGKVPGAENIYWEEFDRKLDDLPTDMPIYLICYTGKTSDAYAEYLQGKGIEAYSIQEGYRGYLRFLMA